MLQELIDTFEELKKYVFIISRGANKAIIIRFNNDNFYHLVGLHKTKIDIFFPSFIKSKDKKYKYMKKNIEKFDGILKNQIKEKDTLEFRIKTFHHITDLLKSNDKTILYNLKSKVPGSMYNGDYGLFKIYEEIYCLFGLACEHETNEFIHCAPQSWMASNRPNKLINGKRPIFMENITVLSATTFNDTFDEIAV